VIARTRKRVGVEGGSFAPKRAGKGKRRRKSKKGKKAGERESVNNDTSGNDLDEHAVLRLSWPAEMMCIPAKLSLRQA